MLVPQTQFIFPPSSSPSPPPPPLPLSLLQVMLENDDALHIVKADLANLVASARRDGAKNAEVRLDSTWLQCRNVHIQCTSFIEIQSLC